MNKSYKLFFCFFVINFIFNIFSNSDKIYATGHFKEKKYREDFFHGCVPNINNFHELKRPKIFFSSNNLLKKSNINIYAIGEKMVLEGYVVNQNCVPIPNAVIKIWQKNNYGFYQDDFNKNSLNGNAYQIQKKLNSYNQYFTGNGVATTDNTGYFHFITLIPCLDAKISSKCVPEIEMSVHSADYKNFEGRILIPEIDRCSKNKLLLLNKYNFDEKYVAELIACKKDNLTRFRYNISLYGKNGYRKH